MMKSYVAVMGLITLLLATSTARAADSYRVYGIGAESCGAWTEARANRGEFAKSDANDLTEWAEAYLTAAGHYGRPLKTTDVPGIQAYLDQYCASHPVSVFEDAVLSLVETLRH